MALRTFTFLCLGPSLLACGPSSTQPTGSNDASAAQDGAPVPATGPIPEGVGPLAIAQAICNKVARCGCDWSTAATCVNDQVCSASTCVSGYTTLYEAAGMGAALAGEVYDPQGARQCVDAIAAASCLDVDYTNLCTITWNGTVALGRPCSATQACETTSRTVASLVNASHSLRTLSAAGDPSGRLTKKRRDHLPRTTWMRGSSPDTIPPTRYSAGELIGPDNDGLVPRASA